MSEPKKPRRAIRRMPTEAIPTAAGRTRIETARKEAQKIADDYRPFVASKAVRFISDGAHDFRKGKRRASRYEQTIRASTIKTRIQELGLDTASLDGAIVNEFIEKIISESAKDEETRDETPLVIQKILDGIEILVKRKKISDEAHLIVTSALRDISASPASISGQVLRTEKFMRKRGPLNYPSGETIRNEQAELVNEFLNSSPSVVDKVLNEYAFFVSNKVPYPEVNRRMSRKMRDFDFSQKRIDFRDKPAEGTVRDETEQQKAGERILAAIDLYHTQKKIPVVITDLASQFDKSRRLTPSQIFEVKAILQEVRAKHLAEVNEKKAGKAKIYEMYRSDGDIVPSEMVIEAFEEWKNRDSSISKSKYAELMQILGQEVEVLMSQIHRIWPILGPENLEREIPWYIFGEGVHRVLKPEAKKLKDARHKTIEDEEVRILSGFIDGKAKELESNFQTWLINATEGFKNEFALQTLEVKNLKSRIKDLKKTLTTHKRKDISGKYVTKDGETKWELVETIVDVPFDKLLVIEGKETDELQYPELRPQYVRDIKDLERELSKKEKWLVDNEERAKTGFQFDEAEERKIRVEAPLKEYISYQRNASKERVEEKKESAEFRKLARKRMANLTEEELEKNAVELTMQRARAEAKRLQDTGFIQWRGVRKVQFDTALPFIVNSYMREARLAQVKILDGAIRELGKPRNEEEEALLKEMKWKRGAFARISRHSDKKQELDGIWKYYEQKLYAPKESKSDLIELKRLVKGEVQQENEIQRLIDWLSINPKEKITPNDMILPRYDLKEKPAKFTGRTGTIEEVLKTGFTMDYPISRERLYDDLKQFRESENKSVSDLAIEISRKIIDAKSALTMGGERNALSRDLADVKRKYKRKAQETIAIDPKNPKEMSRILRLRFEDEYISPDYAMDAFGILSLMESGMLKTTKKPSDFLEEYLAYGRMLDPASTFPEVAKDQSIQTYAVIPSMTAIKHEFETVHANPTIRDWSKTQSLDDIFELSKSGLLDPYLLAAVMKKVEIKDVVNAYEKYQSAVLTAKEKMKQFGQIFMRRITKGKMKDKYEIRKVFDTTQEKMDDGSIRITSPALIALNQMPKKRTKEQHTMVKEIENILQSNGFKKSEIEAARDEISYILTFMTGDEEDFIKTYHDHVRFIEKRTAKSPTIETRLAMDIDFEEAFPALGPHIDEVRKILAERFPDEDIPDGELLERLTELKKELPTTKKDMTKEDMLLSKRIFELIEGINEKRWREGTIGVFEDARITKAFVALTDFRRDMVNLWKSEITRVKSLKAQGAVNLQQLIEDGVLSEEDRELYETQLEEIKPSFSITDILGEDASFDYLGKVNKRLGTFYGGLKFLEKVKAENPTLYVKGNLFQWFSEMIEKKTKKKPTKEEVENLAAEAGMVGGLKRPPVNLYLEFCAAIALEIEERESILEEITVRLGRPAVDTSIRLKVIKDKCEPAVIEHMESLKSAEAIMTFLGTPHQISHRGTKREIAEKFFGINDYLKEYDLSSY